MCEAKPGVRCAADSRPVCDQAACDYRDAHPGGPSVDPLSSARSAFDAQPIAAVTMPFARRRGSAQQFGATYGQDIEPHGRYLSVADPSGTYPEDLFETGEVTFARPLRINFGGGYSEADNWKRRLSKAYGGETGRDLSNALVDDGYDAVITHDKYGTSEVVDLTEQARTRSWATTQQVREGLTARHPGLQVWLEGPNSSGYVTLSKIVVPKDERRSGLGTRAMFDIVETADRNGWSLALTPSADFGSSKARLEQFYRRFGFVPNKGRAKDYVTQETFLRPPR